MIDFHTHILFGMDDGAQSLEESLELINIQRTQGVTTIVVTPHYNCTKQDLNEFIEKRDRNLNVLRQAVHDLGWDNIKLLAGSEVLYSTDLHEMDLTKLVIEGTDYILIEFSTNSIIMNLQNRMQSFINDGYLPIIAHIERYPFFRDKPSLITELIQLGCLMQVNASTFIEGTHHNFIKACIKHNLIHFVASDCHSVDKRKPNIRSAYKKIEKQYGNVTREYYMKNSAEMVLNEEVKMRVPSIIKLFFGKYI